MEIHIIRENEKSYLLDCGGITFHIPKRHLRKDGSLTDFGVECYNKAKKKANGEKVYMKVYAEIVTEKAVGIKVGFYYKSESGNNAKDIKVFFTSIKQLKNQEVPKDKMVEIEEWMLLSNINKHKKDVLSPYAVGSISYKISTPNNPVT